MWPRLPQGKCTFREFSWAHLSFLYTFPCKPDSFISTNLALWVPSPQPGFLLSHLQHMYSLLVISQFCLNPRQSTHLGAGSDLGTAKMVPRIKVLPSLRT